MNREYALLVVGSFAAVVYLAVGLWWLEDQWRRQERLRERLARRIGDRP